MSICEQKKSHSQWSSIFTVVLTLQHMANKQGSRTALWGVFHWEIWIFLKPAFWICNRLQNPKTDFNAEMSVFGFPLGNLKKDLENCP